MDNIFNMKNLPSDIREQFQFVTFSKDDNKQVEQSVTYDPSDSWMNLVHAGNEISLSRENWENLKKLADKTLSVIDDNDYQRLKNLKLKDSSLILTEMTDLQIMDLVREDAKVVKFKYWDVRGFTKLLVQELFKRNGLGYKSIHQLSRTQQAFIENLKIYEKKSFK